MNTLLTTTDVIKEEIEVSETLMQEQLLEASLEEDTVDAYVTLGSPRTHVAKNDLNQHDAVAMSFQSKCLMFFSNPNFFQSHMRKNHGETCPICSKSCKNKSVLSVHMSKHRKKVCLICNVVVSNSKALEYHMNIHTGARPFKCDQCATTYSSPQALKTHSIIHLDLQGKYKCSFCLKSYYRKLTLSYHINTHTGARPFKCNQCPKAYFNPNSLANHRKLHLPGITSRVECYICSKTFSCSRNLRYHMNTHTGARPYKCSQCQDSFANPRARKEHQKAHLQGDKSVYKRSDRSFKCHQCVKAYASLGGLTQHYRDYPSHGSHEHKCSMCSKAFCFKRSLNDHMKTHLEAPAYRCDECPKEFYSTRGLGCHRRTHLIDSKHLHKCPVCNETFTVKQNLIAHMNIHDKDAELDKVVDLHTAVAKYKCKECDKEFISERNLHFHLRLHVKELIS